MAETAPGYKIMAHKALSDFMTLAAKLLVERIHATMDRTKDPESTLFILKDYMEAWKEYTTKKQDIMDVMNLVKVKCIDPYEMPQKSLDEVRIAYSFKQRIGAIKAVREHTNCSLADARDWVAENLDS